MRRGTVSRSTAVAFGAALIMWHRLAPLISQLVAWRAEPRIRAGATLIGVYGLVSLVPGAAWPQRLVLTMWWCAVAAVLTMCMGRYELPAEYLNSASGPVHDTDLALLYPKNHGRSRG